LSDDDKEGMAVTGGDKTTNEVLQGTLDLLILNALAVGPMHGWGISQRLLQVSREVLQVNQGSLYPALQRLERQGWVRSSWGTSENNRRARYYELTRSGERQMAVEAESWRRFRVAVERVLAAARP
jgi:transcriptional regulator